MHRRTRPGRERGRREGQAAALAEAGHGDARGIHEGMGGSRLDGPHRIGIEAPEVVRLGRVDAARHDAGVLGAGCAGARIPGRAGEPLAALAARVHHEHGMARGGEQRVIDRERAAAAVADEGDEARERAAERGRRNHARMGSPPKPLNVTSSTASAR